VFTGISCTYNHTDNYSILKSHLDVNINILEYGHNKIKLFIHNTTKNIYQMLEYPYMLHLLEHTCNMGCYKFDSSK